MEDLNTAAMMVPFMAGASRKHSRGGNGISPRELREKKRIAKNRKRNRLVKKSRRRKRR